MRPRRRSLASGPGDVGYPMTWVRVLSRNRLYGSYFGPNKNEPTMPDSVRVPEGYHLVEDEPGRDLHAIPYSDWTAYERMGVTLRNIRGDLRRLENDQRDERHLAEYARMAGITTEQVRAVLDALFEGKF